jgi:hypothetical protein
MSLSLSLHVTCCEGRGIPLTGRYDRLYVIGAIGGVVKSSGPAGKRNAIGTVTWSREATGEVSWCLGDLKQFARLEASSPTVRMNLIARSSTQEDVDIDEGNKDVIPLEETYIGYVLIPLKSLERRSAQQKVGGFEQWLPIAGAGPGAALRLRACIVETITDMNQVSQVSQMSKSGITSTVSIEAPMEEESIRRSNNTLFNTTSSRDVKTGETFPLPLSVTNTLSLTEDTLDAIPIGHRGNLLFDLNIRIGSVRGLAAALGAKRFPLPSSQLWLSYSLFGVLVQTSPVDGLAELEDEFGGGIEKFTDTFTMQSCLADIALFLAAMQPVQILLCAPGEVIAQTEISLSQLLRGMPPSILPRCSNGNSLTFTTPTSVDELELAEPTIAELAFLEKTFEGTEMEGEFPLSLSVSSSSSSSMSVRSQIAASSTLHAYVSLVSRSGKGGFQQPSHTTVPQQQHHNYNSPPSLSRSSSSNIDTMNSYHVKGGQSEAARALESMKELVAGLISSGRLGDALANGQSVAATVPPAIPIFDNNSNNTQRKVSSNYTKGQVVSDEFVNDTHRTTASSRFQSRSPQSSLSPSTHVQLEKLEPSIETKSTVQAGLLLLSPIKIEVDEIQLIKKEKEDVSIKVPRKTLLMSYESLFVPPMSVLKALGVEAKDAGQCIKQSGEMIVNYHKQAVDDITDLDGARALILHIPSHFKVAVAHDENSNSESNTAASSSNLSSSSSSSKSIPVEPSGIVTFSILIDTHTDVSTSDNVNTTSAYATIPAAALVQASFFSASSSLLSVNLTSTTDHNDEKVVIGTLLLRISRCIEEEAEADDADDDDENVKDENITASNSKKEFSENINIDDVHNSKRASEKTSQKRNGSNTQNRAGNDTPVQVHDESQSTSPHLLDSSTIRLLREEVDAERRNCASLRLEVEIEKRRADAAETRQREEADEKARERRGRVEAEDECIRLRNRLAETERARDETERALSTARSEVAGLNAAVVIAESRALHLVTTNTNFSQSMDGSSSGSSNSNTNSASHSVIPPAGPAASTILAALQNQISPPLTLEELLRDHPALRLPAEKIMSRLKLEAEAAVSEWQRSREIEWLAAKAKAESDWRKDESEREEKKMIAMEGAWAEREAERQAILVEAQERVRDVESRVRKLLSGAELKMKEAERTKEDAMKLLENQKLDLAAMQRRVREDGEHAMSQARAREAAVERRVHDAEAESYRLRETVKMLEIEAIEAKRRESTSPETGLRDAMAIATAEVEQMRKEVEKKDVERKEMETMRDTALIQVLRLAKEVGRLRDQIEAQKLVEAEKLRVIYLVGEERLVLDGDRERLREIKREVDNVRQQVEKEVAWENRGEWEGDEKVKNEYDIDVIIKKENGILIKEDVVNSEMPNKTETDVGLSSYTNEVATDVVTDLGVSSEAATATTATTSQGSTNEVVIGLGSSLSSSTSANDVVIGLGSSLVSSTTSSTKEIASSEPHSKTVAKTGSFSSSSVSSSSMNFTPSTNGVTRALSSQTHPNISSPPGGDSLVRRLKAERKALIDAGAGYSVSHPLVKRIDRALAEASGKLGSGGSSGI